MIPKFIVLASKISKDFRMEKLICDVYVTLKKAHMKST